MKYRSVTKPACFLLLIFTGCSMNPFGGNTAVEHYVNALSAEQAELYEDAVAELEKAVEADHEFSLAHSMLGDLYRQQGNYEKAAHAYRRAYDLFKHDETYKQNTINAFVAYGDERYASYNHDDAVEAFREAFKIDPTNVDTKQKLADAYNRRGIDHKDWERYEKAVLDFKEALRLFPDNPEYQANYDSVSLWDPDLPDP